MVPVQHIVPSVISVVDHQGVIHTVDGVVNVVHAITMAV